MRIAITLGTLAAAAALVTSSSAQTGRDDSPPLRYVLAGSGGAKILNFPDKKGLLVYEAAADTPLAVYSEGTIGSYLKVEVPGGVRVWVYGQYLKPTLRPGWLEVTGNQVQMRPLPSSGSHSHRVGKLYSGDRVRLIERQDPAKPMSQDWVRVWSPPDTRAWVLAAETRGLPPGANGEALWTAAATAALAADAEQPEQPEAVESAAPTAPGPTGAAAAFRAAEELEAGLDTETPPSLDQVRAAYTQVLDLAPSAPTRKLVEQKLRELDLREEFAKARAEIAVERDRREEMRQDYERQIAEASLRKDPLWGRFQERGWLEATQTSGQEPVYRVRWGGNAGPRVVCTSGRYDLSVFAGFEVGIEGFPLRATELAGESLARIDVRRIEVISGRIGPR